MHLLILLMALVPLADARGKAKPVPIPEPTPTSTPRPCPSPGLIQWGPGASPTLKPGGADYQYGQNTLCALNRAWASGCMLEKALAWDFLSLHGVVTPALQKFQKTEALQRYGAGAPYALDARWYSTWGSVVGYTFNYRDGFDEGESETRVWTNTRKGLSSDDYASHLAHELSHQARAGGFVHYSFHQGSFPYEIGDIAWECIVGQRMQLQLSLGEDIRRPKPRPPELSGCYR